MVNKHLVARVTATFLNRELNSISHLLNHAVTLILVKYDLIVNYLATSNSKTK